MEESGESYDRIPHREGIEKEENGLSPRHAILEAAHGRLRPILLTTTTTIGGLLPLSF